MGGDETSAFGNDAATPAAGAGGAASEAGGGGAPSDGGAVGWGDAGAGTGRTAQIPAPTGACPVMSQGLVTFQPAGQTARSVEVWMTDAAKTKRGPLLFYWHGTGSRTAEAAYSLGATLGEITAAGGVVVAPSADPGAGQFPWYLVSSSREDDLRLADEIVGCAVKNVGIDAQRIHSMGMSAGGLQTTAMSFLRSSYIASVAIYSGGLGTSSPPAYQDPANKFAAMVFHGGSSDNVFNFDFQAASERLKAKLTGDGHPVIMCNHGRGHAVPTDAASSVAAFFQAHRFGASPSPYAGGLPPGFPAYCAL